MNKVRVGGLYVFNPVGMDIWSPCTTLKAGTKVKVINMHGCPPANTMGHCHVQDMNGDFRGLVLCNSLQKISS